MGDLIKPIFQIQIIFYCVPRDPHTVSLIFLSVEEIFLLHLINEPYN
jgi:hypothetical protein